MNASRRTFPLAALFLCALAVCRGGLQAQRADELTMASVVILPQRSSWVVRGPSRAEVTAIALDVRIKDQSASTIMDISLSNPGTTRVEAELVVPVPSNAVVRGFAYEGARSEPTARLLARAEARRLYEAIVAQSRDPAILEFIGHSLVRSCVFPVEARANRKCSWSTSSCSRATVPGSTTWCHGRRRSTIACRGRSRSRSNHPPPFRPSTRRPMTPASIASVRASFRLH